MNKTTTRLATVAVVIVLGAFAIALAQHDARGRQQDSVVTNDFATEPAIPIGVTSGWSSERGIASEDNGSLPGLPSGDAPVRDAWEDEPNPLRDGLGAGLESELASGYEAFEELSDVVQAAAEETLSEPPPSLGADAPAGSPLDGRAAAEQPPTAAGGLPSPPADEGAATLPSLPNFPDSASGGAGEALPSFPIGAAASGNLPAALPRAAATPNEPQNLSQALPPNPNQAALGNPRLPELPQSRPRSGSGSGSGQQPFAGRNVSDLSDTQRGAMAATDLATAANQSAAARQVEQFAAPDPRASPGPTGQPAAAPIATGQARDASDWPASRIAASASPLPASLAALVSNQPGNRYLDGSQNPILLIHKRAPEEIHVGRKATFVITVRNAGNATAHDVTVVDSVPRGVRFTGSSPAISPTAEGLLTWKLGEMPAGDEKTISVEIVPEAQGEVGSVASVHFVAQASVRTIATQPRVEILLEAQSDVLIGDAQQINVTIKNTGTGVARNVRLEADIPPQLRHESGESLLDAVIGDLRPNEVKRLGLVASAVQPGRSECVVRAVNDDGVQAEQSAAIDVRSPQLVASIEGPSLRYLERQAKYRVEVQNTGTAAATNLDFVAHLPQGLKFISTDVTQSAYDPKTNTVSVGLPELAAGQTAPIELTVLPVELGVQVIKFNAKADLGITAEAKGQVVVDGLAELAFTIGQDNGTVEVGASSTYSVQVTNVGNKPDKDIQLVIQLPAGAELLATDPGDVRQEADRILFAPIVEMGNKDQRTFRFQVRHTRAGNQVVRAQLTSANWPVAVVKEEGTLVYNDRN